MHAETVPSCPCSYRDRQVWKIYGGIEGIKRGKSEYCNSHLCTPSTCSLVKPLDSPPPESWRSLSGWAPVFSELFAGLLQYAPFPAELPFFVNASNKAGGGRKTDKVWHDEGCSKPSRYVTLFNMLCKTLNGRHNDNPLLRPLRTSKVNVGGASG